MRAKLSLVNGINHKELSGICVAPGEGIVALDQKGRVKSLNNEAERILGWSSEDLVGRDFFASCKLTLDDLENPGKGSQCPALKSVSCPHLHDSGFLQSKDGKQVAIKFMLTSLNEEGRSAGKVFVFRPDHQTVALPDSDQGLVDAAASIVIRLDAQGQVAYSNRSCLFGDVDPETLLPDSLRTMFLESPHLIDQQTILDRRWLTGHKKECCIAWSIGVSRDSSGEVTGAVCIGNDFTDHLHTLKGELHQSQMMQEVFEHINDGVITVDCKGSVTYINSVAEQLTGWDDEQARGALLKDVYHVLDEGTLTAIQDPIERCIREQGRVDSQEYRILLRRGGWEFVVKDCATPLRDAEGNVIGAVLIFSDVSELRGMERWLEYESSHDSLTGLINRGQFEERLKTALADARNEKHHHALLYLDLDQFKLVNDSCGYAAGDQLLKELSSMLIDKLAEGDSIARVGGDEFGVILWDCPPEKARRRAKLLCNAVRDFCFVWNDKPFELGVSVGLVLIDGQVQDLDEIFRMVDSACYVAKQMGRNRVHVYQPQDIALSQRDDEVRWIQRIRTALKDERFQLYCQNIVPLGNHTSSAAHYEILLRMMDDNGVVQRPAAFIAAAERYHLMPTIDRWVISTAIRLLDERRARGDDQVRAESRSVFSINISGQSLDDDEFLGFVVDQFHCSEVPPESICFEITETTAASSLMAVQKFIAVLRGMGCRFALDDFGRGVSSFAYLKNLDVDFLKIDGLFVRGLANDQVGQAMVESINHIGHVMGVQTIAEFVETREILEKLVHLGVDHVQGYQMGHPRPLQPAFTPPMLA